MLQGLGKGGVMTTEAQESIPAQRVMPEVSFIDFGLTIGRRRILHDINLVFRAGRLSALLGPKGSGKSTLLRAVVGLEGFTGKIGRRCGEIRIDDQPVPHERVEWRRLRRRLALVPASAAPFAMSVFDNVAAGCRALPQARSERREWVRTCLERCGLGRLDGGRGALSLSQGERRFLCIARALAMEPSALLLDEPFDGLDPYETGAMEQLLASLSREHTVMLGTQHVERAAAISADMALLIGGELIESGSTPDLLSRPKDPRTEAYLTGRPLRSPISS
jgi:phosphate transport system ATP-binding protein